MLIIRIYRVDFKAAFIFYTSFPTADKLVKFSSFLYTQCILDVLSVSNRTFQIGRFTWETAQRLVLVCQIMTSAIDMMPKTNLCDQRRKLL